MRRYYPATVDRETADRPGQGLVVAYGIAFPDFPGCVSAGASAEEAIEAGHEALAGHVALMVADGDPIPDPTPLERVTWEEDEDVVCVTLVPVSLPGRAVRLNISLDEGLLDEIDAVAGRGKRSAFLAAAARAELARRHG